MLKVGCGLVLAHKDIDLCMLLDKFPVHVFSGSLLISGPRVLLIPDPRHFPAVRIGFQRIIWRTLAFTLERC